MGEVAAGVRRVTVVMPATVFAICFLPDIALRAVCA
jgi:hypothetical protein